MRWRVACLLGGLFLLGFDIGRGSVSTRGASASTFVEMSLTDLVRLSTVVVVGTAADQTSVWEDTDGGSRRIVTYTRVRVGTIVGGTPPAAPEVWVRTLGGQVGDIGQRVDGEAVLVPQRESLLFLRSRSDGTHSVTAMAQGHFPVVAPVDGAPRRIVALPSTGRVLPRLGPAAPAGAARTALDSRTLDEAAAIIALAWRGRAH